MKGVTLYQPNTSCFQVYAFQTWNACYKQWNPIAFKDIAMSSSVRRGKKGSTLWGPSSVAHLDRKEKPLQWIVEALLPARLITAEAGRVSTPTHSLWFQKVPSIPSTCFQIPTAQTKPFFSLMKSRFFLESLAKILIAITLGPLHQI